MICKKCKKAVKEFSVVDYVRLKTERAAWGNKEYHSLESEYRRFYVCENDKCTHYQLMKVLFPTNEV